MSTRKILNKKRRYNGHRLLLLCILCLFGLYVAAYNRNEKKERRERSQSKVILLHADDLNFDEYRHPGAQILTGNVAFRHEDVLMYCDSACIYKDTNSFDAFGHVKMVQGDTLTLVGDVLYYSGLDQLARVRHNVVLTHRDSKLYTDISLMTSKYEIGEEINTIFNHLSLGETESNTQYLMVAPNCMITKIFEYIDEQIELAKSGKEAYVGFKCNSVTSKRMIDKLIEASQAGVKIDMIVRGICCIIPGVQGYTENIRVISIVGRYLEHSRIYIFGKGDNQKIYISSADLMTRNLARRVEVAAPILDEKIKKRLVSMFNTMLKDNVKACELLSDGSYKRIKNKLPELNSQEYFFK